MRYYSNTAALATITNVGGISTGSTEITLSTSTGFPGQYPYTLRLDPDTASEELVTVTGPKSGSPGTFLISRGQDGTTAKSHAQGAVVVHGVSARDFQESQNHIAATGVASVHGLPESAWEANFTVYKGVDQAYSNDTTLHDDTKLRFTASANTKYRVEMFAVCSGLAGNIKLAWRFPAGASAQRSVMGPALNSTSRDDTNVRLGSHSLATEVPYGLNSDIHWAAIQERFVITIASTGGEVCLQHAQNTASSEQTVMRAPSYMVVTKLING